MDRFLHAAAQTQTSDTNLIAANLKITIAFLLLIAAQPAYCQSESEQQSDFWTARQRLNRNFATELQPLLTTLVNSNQQAAARTIAAQLLLERDPNRTYIFLPPENEPAANRFDQLDGATEKQLSSILKNHAEALFNLARKEAESGNSAWALQLFNEVLFYSPDHAEARQLLGHRIVGEEKQHWRVKADRLKIKRSRTADRRFDWPAKSYWLASTENFQIVSTASESQTRELARQLERWKDVWRQLFFEYHNSGKNLNRWIAGTSKPAKSRRKHKVYFFADRQAYLDALSDTNPGIAASTGYYNDANKESFFYADDDPATADTWRHEMTHQLFQESVKTAKAPFNDGYLWLGEGIAMYMESLIDHDSYVTLGGFDGRRLQYARLRRLKEQFHLSIEEASTMSLSEFQSLPEISKVYSQAAGVTHCLMNHRNGSKQRQLIEFLKLLYQGKLKRGVFERTLGTSFATIEADFMQFLRTGTAELAFFDGTAGHRELALVGTPLEPGSLAGLGESAEFDWIDISGCDLRDSRLVPLKSLKRLDRLFLTGAIVNDAAVEILVGVPAVELDLSGSNLNDQQLAKLAESSTLRILNVAGTRVSADAIGAALAAHPDLKLLSN